MLMGSPLEEVWGQDFLKKKKKKNKKKEIVDPEILIPDTREWKHSDIRKTNREEPIIKEDEFKYPGYDNSFDSNISSYIGTYNDVVNETNNAVKETQRVKKDTITISTDEYNNLKNNNKETIVEGFRESSDEQFNQLLLYIFTGIFFIMSMDTMY